MKKNVLWTAAGFALVLALSSTLAACSAAKKAAQSADAPVDVSAAKAGEPALSGEQTAPLTPVIEDAAAAEPAALAPAAEAAPEAADKPTEWKAGMPGPNGGLVYYAVNGEYYEALAPGNTVGADAALPAGWATPDMEDLSLIYTGLQKAGAADYGNAYYISVSKAGGKARFLRMSDGAEAAGVAGGRKLGVRKFDPSQEPAAPDASLLVYTPPPQQPAASSAPAAPAPKAAAPAPAPKYAIGAEGPGGGVVFSNSGGTYKEVSPVLGEFSEMEYARPSVLNGAKGYRGGGLSDWNLPSIEELKQIYQLQKNGKVNFGGKLIVSKTGGPSWTADLAFGEAEIQGFPGYRIVLIGGGPDAYRAIDFSTGKEISWWTPGEGDRVFNFVAVRSFK